jgi:transaldolase/glucose-6-phosphate isomerase
MIRLGQSPWLDYLRRDLLQTGALSRMVEEGRITGVTSNPTIFEKAIAGSHLYDAQIDVLARRGVTDPYAAFLEIAVDDIRGACDALRPVYDATHGADGFVSLEVPPGLEADTGRTIAEAKRLFALVGRPNAMIKVPGTLEAEDAVEELIASGVNVNITLLFAISAYERAAHAFIRGLERRYQRGLDVSGLASVASFFVSRVDTAVDALLPDGSPLRGQAAVANARKAYATFQRIFSGERWEHLRRAGAKVQRPLWASTGTKNPAYSDILYVDSLVAPNTVNTMPEGTLNAVLDHAVLQPMTADKVAGGDETLARIEAAGVRLDAVTDRLLDEGLASFQADFDRLLARIESALVAGRLGRPDAGGGLTTIKAAVQARLDALDRDGVVPRIWRGDHTLWGPAPAEIADRLGWLSIAERMRHEAPALVHWARAVAAEGYTHAVLLGMGGSSLAPEVLRAVLGVAPGMLDLVVLDSTHPAQVAAVEAMLDLDRTLFIVSSKSGGTIETRSQFEYFWSRVARGDNFVVITDAGSALEKLGRERGVRRIFLNPADIGGRYSALSYFGLVPAALIGADLERLLDRALEAVDACRAPEAATNPGAWLGAILAEAALAGRDKLTLVLPDGLGALGAWIEQLIAESSGKQGRGILPVDGDPPAKPGVYGPDRLFVAFGGHPGLDALEAAGHPVVRLPFVDACQVGSEFFRWEFATAVACHILGVNAFDQPNVQEAKDTTAAVLAGQAIDASTGSLKGLLARAAPGNYVAITAYLPRDARTEAALNLARTALRDRHRLATTVGFGPRFLHSTGQLHKGGPPSGLFIQVVDDPETDLPIPGAPYGFARLIAAQALGDLASLRDRGLPVARVTLRELMAAAQA